MWLFQIEYLFIELQASMLYRDIHRYLYEMTYCISGIEDFGDIAQP